MEKINSEIDLLNVIRDNTRIMMYGAGFVAEWTLKYLKLEGLLSHVLCMVVEYVQDNPDDILDIPVIDIDNSRHLIEVDTILIVAARDKWYSDIENKLTDFKFDRVYFISDALGKSLEKITNSQDVVTNYELRKEIKKYKIQLQEQSEIEKVNYSTFNQFKDINLGRDIVIVGTGPTQTQYIPKAGALHIGVNGAWRRKDIKFDYYFAQDFNRYKMDMSFIENVDCQFFLGRYSQADSGQKYIEAPIYFRYLRDNISNYFIDVCQNKEIYQDIRYHGLFHYGSILFPALHFAMYTNPKRIYLVGCDTTSKGYSYYDKNEKKKRFDNQTDMWKIGYSKFKTFANLFYPDTEIISINPVGLKGLFAEEK